MKVRRAENPGMPTASESRAGGTALFVGLSVNEASRKADERADLERGFRTRSERGSRPGIEMRQNYRDDQQNHEPLAHEERISRLFEKHAGIHRCLVAGIPDDDLPGDEAPEEPDNRSSHCAQPNSCSVHGHDAPPLRSWTCSTPRSLGKCTPKLGCRRSFFFYDRQPGMLLGCEQPGDGLLAVLEGAFELCRDQESVYKFAERTEANFVVHRVPDYRARDTIANLEPKFMPMMPALKGTLCLNIFEMLV